ncbi:flavodoxin domain-containing protein [Bacillus sp. AK128]
MRLAIIYTSGTGNTEEVASIIHSYIGGELYNVHHFPLTDLEKYDAVLIGSYTWGNGNLPREMIPLYQAFEAQDVEHVITGVFGTGDSFYPNFCGAVDELRDMLSFHTNLAVTLKIEQRPQREDIEKCKLFVDRILARWNIKKTA